MASKISNIYLFSDPWLHSFLDKEQFAVEIGRKLDRISIWQIELNKGGSGYYFWQERTEYGLHKIWRDVDILIWPWCDLHLDVWPWPY